MKLGKTVISILGLSILSIQMAHAAQLMAGAGKADISSDLTEFPYTAPGEKPFVGIHDHVYARSIVFAEGNQKVALVVLEMTDIPKQIAHETIHKIAAMLHIPEQNILLSASHTHGVPLTFFHTKQPDPTIQKELARAEQGALDAVHEANQSLVKAEIGYARGQGWVNINSGESQGINNMYDSDHHFKTSEANPDGLANRNLDVIRIDSLDHHQPIAMLVNYASHGEVMFRSATKHHGYEETGDLPGAVSNLLESRTASGAPVVLYTAGAEADQLPLLKSRQLAGDFPYHDEGAGGWAVLDLLARRLASSVVDTAKTIQQEQSDVAIKAASQFVTCPGQTSQRDPNTTIVSYQPAGDVNIGIGTIQVGPIAFAGVSGDLSTQIGNAIKQKSPVADTVVVSMRAGDIGYVLSDDFYRYPNSHAVAGSRLQAGCAETAISQGVSHLLQL